MTCETYAQLLERALTGDASPAELEEMRRHEAQCLACAHLHQDAEALRLDLASLKDEAPPMPADFHQRWTTLVEEDHIMEQPKKSHSFRHQFTRFISVAAALVFVIGGTLLTRDDLAPRRAYQSKSVTSESAYTPSAMYANYQSETAMPMMAAGSARATSVSYEDYDMEEAVEDMAYDNGMAEVEAEVNPSKIIRTASLTISTRDYDASMASLRSAVEQHGGWISYCSESTTSGSLHRASMTLRIPSQKLDAFLASTGDVGRVTARSETATDVSDSYYDTKTRLATQQALLARLQALIVDAADLSDLLKLENQIANTQYTIDKLTGSLRATDRQVDYATVDVTLREESAATEIVQTDLTLGQRIASAFAAGWEAFADFCEDVIVFVVAALPFIAVVAVLIVIICVVKKRRAKKANK